MAARTEWHIITGEYPPQPGGVSDYTRQVARALAQAGDAVCVWAPACTGPDPLDRGVKIRRVPGNFGPRALFRLWREFPVSARILVQYVPHAFGWKAMNVPFCLWIWSKRHNPVWIMFHEVGFPIRRGQPLLYNVLGVVHHCMDWIVLKSADRIWVAIPAWETVLRTLSAKLSPIEWLPVPSNIPVVQDSEGIAAVRARHAGATGILVGHFGLFARPIAEMLYAEIPAIVRKLPGVTILLIGRGSREFARKLITRDPDLSPSIQVAGGPSSEDVSRSISACDVMLQPYPDGVSSRRGSSMALAHGRPVLTTKGPVTEPFWEESQAVALAPAGDTPGLLTRLQELIADGDRRQRMGAAAAALYESRFDLRHTVAALHARVGAPWISTCEGVGCESRL
jgi:glycosyltransferase involved in cell wall biosynthesis